MGADLFLPLSEEETQMIVRIVREKNYWIDLIFDRKAGDFQTKDGLLPTYTNWGPGEPNSARYPYCVHLRANHQGFWNDFPCS